MHNCLDVLFCFCILMLGANTTEVLSLTNISACLLKSFCSKNSIVTVVMLDMGRCLFLNPFIRENLVHDSLTNTKRDLILNMYNLRSSIIKDGYTMENVCLGLMTISSGQLFRLYDHILIHRNKVQANTFKQISNLALKKFI